MVTVESGGDLVENDPTFHTAVDKNLFRQTPLESQSPSLSSLVTLATPGIAGDSNGLFHGVGDHADNPSLWTDSPSRSAKQSLLEPIPLDLLRGAHRRSPPTTKGALARALAMAKTSKFYPLSVLKALA